MTQHYNDRAANSNTLILSVGLPVITGLLLVIGYFCKGIAEDVSSTKTDVTTIKTAIPYMQQQIDALKSGESALWNRMGANGDQPSTVGPYKPKQP